MAQSEYKNLAKIQKIHQDDKFCLTSLYVQDISLKCRITAFNQVANIIKPPTLVSILVKSKTRLITQKMIEL